MRGVCQFLAIAAMLVGNVSYHYVKILVFPHESEFLRIGVISVSDLSTVFIDKFLV